MSIVSWSVQGPLYRNMWSKSLMYGILCWDICAVYGDMALKMSLNHTYYLLCLVLQYIHPLMTAVCCVVWSLYT